MTMKKMQLTKPSKFLSAFVFLMMAFVIQSSAQELCTNGIDDDNDGLIDLNDSIDCSCSSLSTTLSIIPNPLFEQHSCLPTFYSNLNCADGWEQPTMATPDYFYNAPGSFWSPFIPLPLPQGGSGIGGFIINKHPGIVNPADSGIYNEYIGACLLAPLLAGTQYSIQMDIAGTSINTFLELSAGAFYGPVDITIFGSTTCPTWPILPNSTDCPTSLPEWTELGHISYSADGAWQTITIPFTPSTNIQSIIIGGPCNVPQDFLVSLTGNDPWAYFFIDNLELNEVHTPPQINSSGNACDNNLTLNGPSESATQFSQWYQNGTALPNQTSNELTWSQLNLSEGTFQFVIFQNNSTCEVSEIDVIDCIDTTTFNLNFPNIFTPNGDGDNDTFAPFEFSSGKWQLSVFNRWGTKVFKTTNSTLGWDGGDCASGTYYWVIQPLEGQQTACKSGFVMLLRD
jgi:gliding motility-associated-like protein